MNSSPFINPDKCRTCGECCKKFEMFIPKGDPIAESQIDRILALGSIGKHCEKRDEGDEWALVFHSWCSHLAHNGRGVYSCKIYDSPERPLLCQHFPFANSTKADCQHVATDPRIEALAELEHDQWVMWSKDIAAKEQLSPERLARWESLWVPYGELSEEMKEQDRIWARKSIAALGGEA